MFLRVKVIAASPMTEIVGKLADGTIKVRIAAPTERGRANAELISFLARQYKVPRSAVTIVSGHSASIKLIRLPASSFDA